MSLTVTKERLISSWLAVIFLGVLGGCSSAPVIPPQEVVSKPEPVQPQTSDQIRLKDALTGREMSPAEVAEVSDRFLTRGNEINEQDMARLELLILKALKSPDRTYRPVFWRNLGIIHYSQGKYKQARQELQASNELNPRSARTHYYLALLFAHEGAIYARQGKKSKSRQQFKRADIEMEFARKIEPSNSLYRQNAKQMIGRD
jgi:tetratricopeptide (TPR) repeat protein